MPKTAEVQSRGRGFVRRAYLPRIIGLGLGFFCVAGVFWHQPTPWWQWALLITIDFFWAHVAYQLAVRSSNPYRAEFRNLLIDALLASILLPLMQFNLVPSALIIIMQSLANIASGGVRFMLKGLLISAVGVALGVLLVGFSWQPESSMAEIIACLPFMIVFPLMIGLNTRRLAVELNAQKEQLQILSRTDGLTGLYNRSYLQSCLESEYARSCRLATPVALLMIDLDHFKSINDRFGHAGGDEVLRNFAELLRINLRCVDIIARYGGEEFAVILPQTDPAGAQQIAERLRKALAELTLPGIDCQFTFSAGVAPLRPDTASVEAWLAQADAALYAAKQQGRDRVVLAGTH